MIPNSSLPRIPDNMTRAYNRQLVRSVGAVVPAKNYTKPVNTKLVKADMVDNPTWAKQQNLVNVPLESIYKQATK